MAKIKNKNGGKLHQPIKIDIVKSTWNDQTGVYIDGKLVFEETEVDGEEMLDILKLKYTNKQADIREYFPQNYDEIEFED